MYYAIYQYWCRQDPTITIDPNHPVLRALDVAAAVGQLLVTRMSQTIKKKYEVATEWVTGTPQPAKSVGCRRGRAQGLGHLRLMQRVLQGQ